MWVGSFFDNGVLEFSGELWITLVGLPLGFAGVDGLTPIVAGRELERCSTGLTLGLVAASLEPVNSC